ncbi:MAG: 30S ribosomal protein S8e [Candidatus Aenigmarchaeota archaeon]|nr:30S ribosomal protein S8e [Candidatus Aenigmarchaeota archaeon]
MAVWHGEKGKKLTGGKIKIARKKRKYELGRLPVHTRIGKEKKKIVRTKGGEKKIKAFSVEFANVLDPKTNTIKKVKILDIISNPANPHFVRRGIITKGCIIKTEIGNARVTSRPSQHGIVNALLIEEKLK